jgi:uncharacterized protein YbjT (DUF2867 family)
MAGRVFVTGGRGFVGGAVIDELLSRGYAVNALVRGELPAALAGRVEPIRGDLFDPAALDRGLAGCDAVVHLVGIIFENRRKGATFERIHVDGTRQVVEAARRAGVRRFVHMSSLGSRAGAPATYHRTKHAGEEVVRAAGLDWTIFRPSLIHGPRGEFVRMEVGFARGTKPPFLFMPYFGNGPLGTGGAGKLQPVFVDDVARAFVDAIGKPDTVGKSYCLGGTEVLTWPDLHRAMAEAIVGRRRWVLPMPAWNAKLLARVVPASVLGFNRDQVQMSQEDSTCDPAPFAADFGWTPRGLSESLATYAAELKRNA